MKRGSLVVDPPVPSIMGPRVSTLKYFQYNPSTGGRGLYEFVLDMLEY